MSGETPSIHEFSLELICEYYEALERQGPGSPDVTTKALGFVDGLQDRVRGIVGSMEELPFQDDELDLIWCEGAIYNIGFERGLRAWRRYLKVGGYIAVSEASKSTAPTTAMRSSSGKSSDPITECCRLCPRAPQSRKPVMESF